MLDAASRLEVPLVSDPWLSADDIAIHLGVTKDTVYAWIAAKGMPAHKVGRLWKFQAREVDEWVRNGSGTYSGEDSSAWDGA
jgi:excisionase family DNA binding protein